MSWKRKIGQTIFGAPRRPVRGVHINRRYTSPKSSLDDLQSQSEKIRMARRSGQPMDSAWSELARRRPSRKFSDSMRPVYGPGLGKEARNPDMGKRIGDLTRSARTKTKELAYYPAAKTDVVKAYRSGRSAKRGEPGYIDEVFGFSDDPYKAGYKGDWSNDPQLKAVTAYERNKTLGNRLYDPTFKPKGRKV